MMTEHRKPTLVIVDEKHVHTKGQLRMFYVSIRDAQRRAKVARDIQRLL